MPIEVHPFEIDDPELEGRVAAFVGRPDRWRSTRDFQVGLLDRLGLAPDMSLLDIGCGSLRAGLPVIAYLEPEKYTGVDVHAGALAAASELVAHFGLAGKRARLIRSDTFGIDELATEWRVDRVWCFQVAIHLTPALSTDLVSAIARHMAPNGKAWISISANETGEDIMIDGAWHGFPRVSGPVSAYIRLCAAAGLEARPLGTLGDFGLAKERGGSGNVLLELTHEGANHHV